MRIAVETLLPGDGVSGQLGPPAVPSRAPVQSRRCFVREKNIGREPGPEAKVAVHFDRRCARCGKYRGHVTGLLLLQRG